jgi:cyclase
MLRQTSRRDFMASFAYGAVGFATFAKTPGLWPAALSAQERRSPTSDEIEILKVRETVYLLSGAGANITALIFPQGVLLVDSGRAEMSDKVLAAIRKLSTQPIHYLINTSMDLDHIGGNEKLASSGSQLVGGNVAGDISDAGEGAEIIAHQNVLNRLSELKSAGKAASSKMMPTTTYPQEMAKLSAFYHGDAIELIHAPAAHTDGDTIVWLRRSDVIVTGDIFTTTGYPVIDLEKGGSINGVVKALDDIVDLAFAEFRLEGGTLVIPGHGRLCDSADVAYYRDMVTIIRDRVQDMVKKGSNLQQVKAAKLTRDYDGIYAQEVSSTSPDQFVETVFKSLTSSK